MSPGYILQLSDKPDLEQQIVNLILEKCDTVVWSNHGRQPFVPGLWRPWEKHPAFKTTMKIFKNQFIRAWKDNLEYGEIETKLTFNHYQFKIEGPVRESLVKQGTAYNTYPGLWDPLYFSGYELMVSTVAHENIAIVYADFEW